MKYLLMYFKIRFFAITILVGLSFIKIQSQCNTNVSQGKTATQSSTYSPPTYDAAKANDGNETNINHTNNEWQPWWEVDLGSEHQVTSIDIKTRVDCCGDRIKRFKIFITNSQVSSYSTSGSIYTYDNSSGFATNTTHIIPNITASGRYVRFWVDNTGYVVNPIHISELKVFGCVAGAPTCSDGIQNGTETGVDCGGSCAACPTGENSWAGSTSSTGNVFRSGRVGIGGTGSAFTFPSTETEYNLLVKGGIKSEKFKVEVPSTGGWADHVFNNNYILSPISEVQKFIKVYKHLPGFPSAKEIVKDGGYELSGMIKQQQIGIENLYLYIIELEKKVEKIIELEKRIEELEQRFVRTAKKNQK